MNSTLPYNYGPVNIKQVKDDISDINETVEDINESIESINGSIEDINGSIGTMADDISALKAAPSTSFHFTYPSETITVSQKIENVGSAMYSKL